MIREVAAVKVPKVKPGKGFVYNHLQSHLSGEGKWKGKIVVKVSEILPSSCVDKFDQGGIEWWTATPLSPIRSHAEARECRRECS